MLIEFSVANFRSIRERQTLSMVASSHDESLPENTIHLSLPGLANTEFLKSVVLYGPNASGKSNVLKAMVYAGWFVEHSATGLKPSQTTDVEPFRLDAESEEKPTEFEFVFVVGGVRHRFGFALNRIRVLSEWLYVYPKGRPQCWYDRTFDSDNKRYLWNTSQKHFKKSGDLESQTRDNALFLSVAAQFNHDQLLPVYKWFEINMKFLDLAKSGATEGWELTAALMHEFEPVRKRVPEFLGCADLGLKEVTVETRDFDEGMLPEDLPPELRGAMLKELKGKKGLTPHWIHQTADTGRNVTFMTQEESAGTLRYFSVLGPWLDVLEKGHLLIIDELGASIHPSLVRALLKMLSRNGESHHETQVIFTTHDITLLDREVFRRDQIWFTEKDGNGATHLYPLTDFQPRKDESLAKGYLAGRYGAIPFLTGELAL